MSKYPANMPYQEETIVVKANSVPRALAGLWNFVEVLDTTDATNALEVSFNDGATWTRLRKGIFIPIGLNDDTGRYDGTVGLAFRNPTGADVTISVAVGFGSITDVRLLIDATQGVVPVVPGDAAKESTPDTAADSLRVIQARRNASPLVAASHYATNTGIGAGHDSTTIIAAAANPNGIVIHAGAYFYAIGGGGPNIGQAMLLAKDPGSAEQRRVAGVKQMGGVSAVFQFTESDIVVPAGCDLLIVTDWDWAYDFNYTVL